MRFYSGLLLSLSIAAAISCARAATPYAPPTSQPHAPANPDEPSAPLPSDGARTAEQVCPGSDDVGSSPGKACTEMGCVSGFHLSVEPLDAWPHGDYRYVVDVDGRTITCEGSLPLRGCEAQSITCSDPSFSVTESGCAIDASHHAFGAVMIPGFPSRVHLRIELDGKAVADEELDLGYSRAQPNGPGCGPVCCSASDDVTLRF